MKARLPWLISFVALGVCACGTSTLKLSVKSPPGTNQGRPLYMLVRKVDPQQYAVEPYPDVAAKVVNADPSVLHSEVIYPGTVRRLSVKVPQEAPVAVSFLFTAPDGPWQVLVDPPGASSMDIQLLEGRVQTESDKARDPKGPPSGKPPEAPAAQAPEAPKAPEAPAAPEKP